MTDVSLTPDVDSAEGEAVVLESDARTVSRAWSTNGLRTFALFLALGLVVLAFALVTVFQGRENALPSQAGSLRSHATIAYWQQHGYFRSGGLIHLAGTHEIFWRSSTGAYMFTGYVLEQAVALFTGSYSFKALAIHNLIIVVLSAAFLALLIFDLLVSFGLAPGYAIVLCASCELVALTFPDALFQYWEIYPQPMAVPFVLLFLILERRGGSRVRDLFLEGAIAFALFHIEYVYGFFFFVAYWSIRLLSDDRPVPYRRLLAVTVLPMAASLVVFAVQMQVNRAHYPSIPLEGSGFLVRSGLDGAADYYGEHGDLIYGRNVARANFPNGRSYLFTWRTLFIAGCAAVLFLIVIAGRYAVFRPAMLTLGSLIGAYALYAALFSQAVVIHPYEYDYLLALPLMASVFAVVPGVVEKILPAKGIAVVLALFLAAWYSMVQMRNYALRYPLAPHKTTAPQLRGDVPPAADPIAGQWASVSYAATNFSADSGSIQANPADQTIYRYALIGRTMLLSVSLQTLTASGSPREIHIALPEGRVAAGLSGGAAMVNNSGSWTVSRYYTRANLPYVAVLPTPNGGTFSNCQRCIYLHFNAMFEVK